MPRLSYSFKRKTSDVNPWMKFVSPKGESRRRRGKKRNYGRSEAESVEAHLKSQTGLAPVILIVALLFLGAVSAGGYYFLTTQDKINPQNMMQPEKAPIEQVKEMNEEKLLEMKGVGGVEVGEKDDKPCIIVFTFEETDELENLENNGLDGYQVKIENTTQTQ